MLRFTPLVIAIMMVIMLAAGCSSGKAPITPADSNQNSDLPSTTVENRHLLGVWDLDFDVDSLSAETTPKRDAEFHMNVTSMIPTPSVVIRGYDPIVNIMDIDVTIANPYAFNGYDLRLIIFTNSHGIRLVNPDNWTALWDIPEGAEINPFRAFAKDEDNRLFAGFTDHTERIQLEFPTGLAPVAIAIDASWPGNCEEPYMMNNYRQTSLYDIVDSWASVRIDVYDWQEDIEDVELFCPSILGGLSLPFSIVGDYSVPPFSIYPHTWGNTLKNNTGIGAGNYFGYVKSTSENSGELSLYEPVNIAVADGDPIPQDPRIISTITFGDDVNDVDIDGDFAYLAGNYHLGIVDISNRTEPVFIGQEQFTVGYGTGVVFEGNSAFVSCARWLGTDQYESAAERFDVSNPYDPISVFAIEALYPRDVDVSGDYLYVADYTDGLKIIDLTIPAVVGSYSTSDAKDVIVDGDLAYVADGDAGIKIFYVNDPTNPIFLREYDTFHALDLALQDDYLYVADRSKGLKIFDVSDPFNLFLVGYTDQFYAISVDVQGDYAYVVDGSRGLKVYDISDKHYPYLLSYLPINCANNVVVDGRYAYVAADSTGFVIVKLW